MPSAPARKTTSPSPERAARLRAPRTAEYGWDLPRMATRLVQMEASERSRAAACPAEHRYHEAAGAGRGRRTGIRPPRDRPDWVDRRGAPSCRQTGDHTRNDREIPSPRLVCRFTHELVRRAPYDRMPGLRRAELHLRVAEALGQRRSARLSCSQASPLLFDRSGCQRNAFQPLQGCRIFVVAAVCDGRGVFDGRTAAPMLAATGDAASLHRMAPRSEVSISQPRFDHGGCRDPHRLQATQLLHQTLPARPHG